MPTTYSTARKPATSKTGIPVIVDVGPLKALARDLRLAAPAVFKELRTSIRAAAQVVADEAKVRASFSTRIPQTIKVRGGVATVKVVAGGPEAPDAAPLEHGGQAGRFRHPVFGNRNNWVEQPARPFLAPALEAHREQVSKAIEDAVVLAVERAIKGV